MKIEAILKESRSLSTKLMKSKEITKSETSVMRILMRITSATRVVDHRA